MARAVDHVEYDLVEQTYELKRPGPKAKGWRTFVGDPTVTNKFTPRFRMQRWDDGWFEVEMPRNIQGGGDSVTVEGRAIVWSRGIYTCRFYDYDDDVDGQVDGSFEWEIVLSSPPPVNSWSVEFSSQNVEMLYQPALTAQEIADGHFRPDRVIGSYAVYHTTKRDVRPGQPNYECGKIGHIYRPLATDALGDSIWGEWNADAASTGILTLTIDATWLANAAYPVTIDPTFGYTTAGASEQGGSTTNAYGNSNATYQYTASSGDTATKWTAYCKKSSGAPQLNCAIYDVSSGDPNNLLVQDSITPPAGSPAWTDSGTISQSLTASTTYTIATCAGATSYVLHYDTGGSEECSRDVVSGGTFNDPWSEDLSFNTPRLSIYVTYTAGGGAARRIFNIS